MKNVNFDDEAAEVVDKASLVTRMNTSAAEAEAEAKAKSTIVAGDGKGQEEDEWSEETLPDWQDYLLVSQFLAGGEGEKPLGGGESMRGEELPARLDKTVLEIPAESKHSFSSFAHFSQTKE